MLEVTNLVLAVSNIWNLVLAVSSKQYSIDMCFFPLHLSSFKNFILSYLVLIFLAKLYYFVHVVGSVKRHTFAMMIGFLFSNPSSMRLPFVGCLG